MVDGVAQLTDEFEALAGVAIALAGVEGVPGARGLGLVHRDVGALQQRFGVGAVVGVQRDADARGDPHVDPLDGEALLERRSEAAADRLHAVGTG